MTAATAPAPSGHLADGVRADLVVLLADLDPLRLEALEAGRRLPVRVDRDAHPNLYAAAGGGWRWGYVTLVVCGACGGVFPALRSDARWCSPACRQRAYRSRQ